MTPVDFLYIPNFILLFAGLFGLRLPNRERRFSMYLLQALIGLPLLSGIYIYFSYTMIPDLMPLVLFSENVFAFIWCAGAYWLSQSINDTLPRLSKSIWPGFLARLGILAFGAYGEFQAALPEKIDQVILLTHNDIYFPCAFFLLISAVAMAWQLEYFWRNLSSAQRWSYKYLLVGSYLVCGALGWIASYRLTYLQNRSDHFTLLGVLLIFAWILMICAVGRHRLLNRKLFISRKIVYTFVAPMAFGFYLIGLGILILLMRILGQPLSFVLRWFLLISGLSGIVFFALSSRIRRRVKFFISTHFYVNKYEYRDEWIAFSRLLQGALNQKEIIDALDQVLNQSLYTDILCIWVGDDDHGYRIVHEKGISDVEHKDRKYHLPSDHPLVRYLKTHDYYTLREKDNPDHSGLVQSVHTRELITEYRLDLFTPMISGEQLIGIVGIGPEFTGGTYSHDDFDLLLALGTQAASALQAGRMAEDLSRMRQQEAWKIMSSFVLHDVKNAASMLSLIRQNAPDLMDNPEFQQDLLETIDHALQRMSKVQNLLDSLKGEKKPVVVETDLCVALQNGRRNWMKRLPGMEVILHCESPLNIKIDTEFLDRIMENLLVNAYEAGGSGIVVEISGREDNGKIIIEVKDNGPGISSDLLPDILFQPFKTNKTNGSGVGLWHVKRLIHILRGQIQAENSNPSGAKFTLILPIH